MGSVSVGSVRMRSVSTLPLSTPLIGRGAELAAVTQLAGILGGPRSGVVLLSGDAGIGKSRLVASVGRRAEDEGWAVVVGHCLDLGDSPLPYLPFTEVAGRLAALYPETMRELVDQWPTLRRLVAAEPAASSAEAPDRGVFFESVHAALTRVASTAPLLMVMEDLHWADRSTCDLLSFMFTRGFPLPLSILATYRSDDLHRRHPLRTIAAGWSRLPEVSRIELAPLTDVDVRRLVTALHPQPLAAGAVETVVERAEGNAFFTEELVAAVGSRAVPRDLAGLLLLRLDELDSDARLVVRAAAAGGRLVRDAVLAEVAGFADGRFDAAVRAAVDHNVLVPEDDGYRFRHSMLAEAVYDDLLPGERVRLHAAYAAVLSASARGGTPADLARHALGAQDYVLAFAAAVRAGDDATAVGGPDEAARDYALALDLVTGGQVDPGRLDPPPDVVGLTEKAYAASVAAGLLRRAETIVTTELRRLPADAPPRDRARLLILVVESAELAESSLNRVQTARAAADLVPSEPPSALRARALAALALALAGQRVDTEAVRWAEEGLAMPPELRGGDVTAKLRTVLAKVTERQGDPALSTRVLRQLAAAAHDADDPAEVRILHQLGAVLFEDGELAAAFDAYRRAAERSAALGRPFAPYGIEARMQAGVTGYQLGRWDEVVDLVRIPVDHPPELAAAYLLCVQLAVRAGRGDADGWTAQMAAVTPQWTTDGTIAVTSAAAAIDLAGDAGDLEAAIAVFDDVVARVAALWGTPAFQARIRLTALLLAQIGTHLAGVLPPRRAELLARAASLVVDAHQADGVGRRAGCGPESRSWLCRVDAELLRLHWLAGEAVDPDAMVAAWRASVAAFEGYGHVFETARSRVRLAAALRAHGQTQAATAEALAAQAVAVELGAAPLLAEATGLTGRRGVSEAAAAVLTPREAEVLALVSAGRSNGEIGQQLFISTKTASVHVSNILAKLGARTRTEAVAVARRRGLLS